jgi:hypothetical protein
MSYKQCLEIAGAEVLNFNKFGSYQGDWWALVNYKGNKGWIHGCYGSCSRCDSFEAEFDCDSHEHENGDYIYCCDIDELSDDCPQCRDIKNRLIAFGESYLNDILTQEQAVKMASENLDWDMDAQEMVDFIKDNGIKS